LSLKSIFKQISNIYVSSTNLLNPLLISKLNIGIFMDNIQIRTAKEDDFEAIFNIANNCGPIVSERRSIYHIFTKFFQNTVFIAEKVENKNKIITGFLIGFISQTNSLECYIHQLCVDSAYRGDGVAFALIQRFMDIVSPRGCKKIYLIVKPLNQKAISFYKKMGFKIEISETKSFKFRNLDIFKDYDGFGEHMIVFIKEIE
jgi:ribosomal protein S18 acetylase RimI-like enzyme